MATAEEWRALAVQAILALLADEGAATQPEMEAKISDTPFADIGKRIDPHHLTTARQRLVASGVIEVVRERTRGGRVMQAFVMADAPKKALRAAGRKRLLQARYLSWSQHSTEWGPAPLPTALERIIHASMLAAAPHGYRLIKPEGGEVRQLLGHTVDGGPLDNAAFYTGIGSDGMPGIPVVVPVEAKNLRQWIYPNTQELYQLLDKSARLQLAHPDRRFVPVLVCRRQHYRTGKMAKQVGFHVINTWRQYVRPAVAASEDNRRKFNEVNDELAYNLDLHDAAVPEMVNHFVKLIPARSEDASSRWAQVIAHQGAAELLNTLRDDGLSVGDRHDALQAFAEVVEEVTGEDADWGPMTESGDD